MAAGHEACIGRDMAVDDRTTSKDRTCPECGGMIADSDPVCPHCGATLVGG
jgi:predicted RNA-binding Zn-ribbon protein involved in translation (DUF1610 family)